MIQDHQIRNNTASCYIVSYWNWIFPTRGMYHWFRYTVCACVKQMIQTAVIDSNYSDINSHAACLLIQTAVIDSNYSDINSHAACLLIQTAVIDSNYSDINSHAACFLLWNLSCDGVIYWIVYLNLKLPSHSK